MLKINFNDNANLGGINSVIAVPLSSVQKFDILDNSVTFEFDDAYAIEIYATDNTLKYTYSQKDGIKIDGESPQINKDNQFLFELLRCNYWLVLFNDNNENRRIAGDLNNQLRFEYETDTAFIGGKNAVTWNFYGDTINEPYFVV